MKKVFASIFNISPFAGCQIDELCTRAGRRGAVVHFETMDELRIESKAGSREGVRIIKLEGPFVLQGVFEFQSIARSGNDPVVILDVTEVPFMDSAALGAVMALHTSCQRQQRKYAVVGASERLRTLFDVAGVSKILVTYPTLAEAQEKLSSGLGIAKPAP